METRNDGLVVRLTSTEVCLKGDEPVGCDEERDMVYELWFGGVVPAGEAFTRAELREAMRSGQAMLVGGYVTVSSYDGAYEAHLTMDENGVLKLSGVSHITPRQLLDELVDFGGYGSS